MQNISIMDKSEELLLCEVGSGYGIVSVNRNGVGFIYNFSMTSTSLANMLTSLLLNSMDSLKTKFC